MEEKNSKLLNKHCLERRRRSCDCCKHHLRCVLFALSLIAKRFVFLLKRNVLTMFVERPKSKIISFGRRHRMLVAGLAMSGILFSCLFVIIVPTLGAKDVHAGTELPFASTDDPLDDVPTPVIPKNISNVDNVLVGAGLPATDTQEVTTDVVNSLSQETTDIVTAVYVKTEEAVPTRDEKLKQILSEYDVPLDYDVELAFRGMDYLVLEQGFSIAGASGVIGNFYAECRFDSSLIGGSHKGLAQWDSTDRWPMIAEWLNANGYELTSFTGQLNAIFYSRDANEFNSGNPYRTFEKMREAEDPRDAALVWLYEYERAPGQAEGLRQDIAELTYKLYIKTV